MAEVATFATSDQLLVIIDAAARQADGESVRIAKDVLSAGELLRVRRQTHLRSRRTRAEHGFRDTDGLPVHPAGNRIDDHQQLI